MKKTKRIIFVVAAIAIIALFSTVISFPMRTFAFDASNETWPGCPIDKEEPDDQGVVKMKLNRNAVYSASDNAGMDIEAKAGQNIELDLNGFSLTNFSTNCSTINVFPGGKLTIVDSKGNSGKIYQRTGTEDVPTIYNAGTLVIKTGEITGTTKVNNIPVIKNTESGVLTIEDNVKVTGSNELLSNNGIAYVKAATFDEQGNFYALRNEGNMSITGATVNTTSDNTSAIGNIGSEDAVLTINSVETDGDSLVVMNREGMTVIGSSADKSQLDLYLANGVIDSDGAEVTLFDTAEEAVAVKIGETYFVGDYAEGAIEEAKTDANAKLTVLQGNVNITGAVAGFTVINEGEGKVTVNSVVVEGDYTVPSTKGEEKDDTPKTGIVNYLPALGLVAVATLAGIVISKRK